MIPFGYYHESQYWYAMTFWDDGSFVWGGRAEYNEKSKEDRTRDVGGLKLLLREPNRDWRCFGEGVLGWRV